MTRIIRDVLNASFSDVVNERLFFIVSRIYESHKSYHSAIIRVKMIIRQHDYKKTELEFLNNAQSNLKKEEDISKKKLKNEIKARNQALQDEKNNYINDVDENVIIVKENKLYICKNSNTH